MNTKRTGERAAQAELKVPNALQMAWLLILQPRRLWTQMVLWDLDGDPSLRLLFHSRLRLSTEQNSYAHQWVEIMIKLQVAAALAVGGVLVHDYVVHDYGSSLLMSTEYSSGDRAK